MNQDAKLKYILDNISLIPNKDTPSLISHDSWKEKTTNALETLKDALEEIDETSGTCFNDNIYNALELLEKFFKDAFA